jgi:hypothetical protein
VQEIGCDRLEVVKQKCQVAAGARKDLFEQCTQVCAARHLPWRRKVGCGARGDLFGDALREAGEEACLRATVGLVQADVDLDL